MLDLRHSLPELERYTLNVWSHEPHKKASRERVVPSELRHDVLPFDNRLAYAVLATRDSRSGMNLSSLAMRFSLRPPKGNGPSLERPGRRENSLQERRDHDLVFFSP